MMEIWIKEWRTITLVLLSFINLAANGDTVYTVKKNSVIAAQQRSETLEFVSHIDTVLSARDLTTKARLDALQENLRAINSQQQDNLDSILKLKGILQGKGK